jgi:hypothetical protein
VLPPLKRLKEKIMKVKELIKELQKLNPDAEVKVPWAHEDQEFVDVEVTRIEAEPPCVEEDEDGNPEEVYLHHKGFFG